jgi:xanthine/CO dehydrogenase XdhC/CoxF family maturation factor
LHPAEGKDGHKKLDVTHWDWFVSSGDRANTAKLVKRKRFSGMKELEKILHLWTQAQAAGDSTVLATVVKTQGSSYRLPGARLLLTSRGQRAGSVSGGCLEEDLVRKAWWMTESGPVVRRYDTTPDGEIAAEYGLGCNGIIHVLLERLNPGETTLFDLIQDVRSQRRPAVVAHLLAPVGAIGQKLILNTERDLSHNISDTELVAALKEEAETAFSTQRSSTVRFQSGAEAFIETVAPPVHLLVFGAGDDAVPLTTLAKYLGWKVSVFDGRAHYARSEKFPSADSVSVLPAGHLDSRVKIDPWTVAVLMSHSYSQDLENLRQLSSHAVRYLGILGPRKRAVQLLADAGLDPAHPPVALHSPMGLDIGADGPEQVALAAIAEIQAALNGREGGVLRNRQGSIHASADASGDPEVFWARSIACA